MASNNSVDGDSSPNGQGSQDAQRRQEDAVHHKFPLGPSGKTRLQSQGSAQQDSVAKPQIEQPQPEISKAGSPTATSGQSND